MGYFKRILESGINAGGNRQLAFPLNDGPFDIEIREDGITNRYARGLKTEDVEKFNEEIRRWGAAVLSRLKPSISSFDIQGSRLKRSLKNRFQFQYGEIERISFSFKRHGVFVHKGVGRGYVMRGSTVVKISKTPGFNRQPKPWFNPVIESHIRELEEIILRYTDTAIVNSARIYIH